jgi:2-keto-4-pentenoate hydratase/2-oxohepta-3-ene-1,7-dioic acid hydratase in catechol pathway
MKLFRIGTARIDGKPTPMVLVDDRAFTFQEVVGDTAPHTTLKMFERWDHWQSQLGSAVEHVSGAGRDPATLTYLAPVTEPRKVICIGINYRDHLKEMKAGDPPEYPYAFMRPATSLAGHKESIRLPAGPKIIDWEAEIGIVVGHRFRGDDAEAALAAIAGYTVINDVSARDWIAKRPPVGIDWVMQKAWDQFQPTGPWITPARFISDPQALSIELTVNGVTKQRSNTGEMVFGVVQIMRHLGQIMTLEPGDIVATGTPAGVGFGRNPPEFIKPGDHVRVTIEGLGTLENEFL